MKYSVKREHVMFFMTMFNTAAVLLLIGFLGFATLKNPNHLKLFFVKGESTTVSPVQEILPAFSPIATSTAAVKNTQAATSTKEVFSSLGDYEEKQYIQALVTSYKNQFLSKLVVPVNADKNLQVQLDSIKSQIAACKSKDPRTYKCVDDNGKPSEPGLRIQDLEAKEYIYKEQIQDNTGVNKDLLAQLQILGQEIDSCSKNYAFCTYIPNETPQVTYLKLRQQAEEINLKMQSNLNKYKIDYKNSQLKLIASSFCSNSKIPSSYKDYCISLFKVVN